MIKCYEKAVDEHDIWTDEDIQDLTVVVLQYGEAEPISRI